MDWEIEDWILCLEFSRGKAEECLNAQHHNSKWHYNIFSAEKKNEIKQAEICLISLRNKAEIYR